MSTEQEQSFHKALMYDFKSIMNNICKIDAEKLEAHNKDDENMIKQAVKETVGFNKLNSLVFERLREWLADTGKMLIESLDEKERETSVLLNNVGLLLQDQGKYDETEKYFKEVLEGCRKVLGNDHINTLSSINNMGLLLRDQGKLVSNKK